MYRQGIGDAFLLSFQTGATPSHILIDCGMLTGTKNAVSWAQNICADVADATGGHLNAIAGTHSHWDHLSAFWDAKERFRQLKVDEVWLSWAEDPRDAFANEHKRELALSLDAARRAMAGLAAAADANAKARAAAIRDVLAFQGPELVGAGAGRTDAALEVLRTLVRKPSYWRPGELIERPWLPGVRVYVLGPPRNEKLLGKMLGRKGSEMYGLGAQAGFYAALLSRGANGALAPEVERQVALNCPFDAQLRWTTEEASAHPPLADMVHRYAQRSTAWRSIDDAWLHSAEQLSLKLDNVVNNLSLVLAFELVDTGEVLLFAADAQIGNWLSWGELRWRVAPAGAAVSSGDLLARTIFYKVGHHGSHNATLMQGGLEAMVSPDLVAALPVDQAFANGVRKWDMPAQSLYPHLLEKTRGRVIRVDGAGATLSDPSRPPDKDVRAEFQKRIALSPGAGALYVDYRVP